VLRLKLLLSPPSIFYNLFSNFYYFPTESYNQVETFTPRPRGYWMYDKGKNMRAHLEEIARLEREMR
jgi:hypothetical protein